MALIKFYFELTEKYTEEYGDKTILLMQVGSFFEVYGLMDKNTNELTGSKIMDFSHICELNVVEKNVCIGKNNVYMAGFKDIMIEKYIKKIQTAGYTAVVYIQDQQAKNTTRSLSGVFSPGTYFSLDASQITNNTCCVWVQLIENKLGLTMGIPKGKYIICGMANIDICTGKTILFQFRETYLNNPTTYDQLERFISIHKPSEVIFISNLPVLEMNNVIQYANIQQAQMVHKINICEESITTAASEKVKRALRCEKQIYQKEILERFYQIDDFSVFLQNFYENDISSQAFCFLLDFVYQHNPYLVKKISEPVFETYSDRLILANHTLKQLNIIDDANNNGKYSSVLKMLNICVTPMGKRKFSYQFLNPRMDEDYLNKEYDITEYMVKNSDFFQFLRIKLLDIKDISKWTRQIYMKKISPKLVCQIYSNLETIQTIYGMLKIDATFMDYLGAETSGNVSFYAQEMREFIFTPFNISNADYL